MSQEAADFPVLTGADVPAGPEAHPQAPMLVVRPDPDGGTVRVHGYLERLGAELLVANLEFLQRQGHREITVQLAPSASADAEALTLLDDLTHRLAVDGVRLRVD
jgi:hypothetical protein